MLDEQTRRQAPGRFVELEQGPVHCIAEGPEDGQPVVLVHGFSVRKAIPAAEFTLLPGAGHALHYEQADQVNRELLAFLGQN